MRRKAKATERASEVQALIRAFGVTGDFASLAAAADKIEEDTGVTLNPCRVAFDSCDERIHWFFVNGGGYRRAGEDAELTQLRMAVNLARAEQWALAEGMWADWEDDDDYDPSGYDSPGMPEFAFGCVIHGRAQSVPGPFDSLWGITFDGDGLWYTPKYGYPPAEPWPTLVDHLKPYARIVCAELCEELMPDELSI
jgi:hypothetical protein